MSTYYHTPILIANEDFLKIVADPVIPLSCCGKLT